MGKEGLMAVAQHKRLVALTPAAGHLRLERFMRSNVSRLLRTDLLAVLAEGLPTPISKKSCVLNCFFFVHD
jgi:ribonuclease T2